MPIPKLTTKFDFSFEVKPTGVYTTVVRLADGATKTFFHAGHTAGSVPGLTGFMNSITDELAESYFPKPRKEKK